ncbi:MAG: TolC family protein [Nitrospirae bacterium]|nr:TolC family protein [Nitrospirota bacterium]
MIRTRKTDILSTLIGLMILSGTAAGPVLGQTSELVCDLNACLNYAVHHRPEVSAADAKEITQTAAVFLKKTQFRPTLNLSGDISYVNGEPTSYFGVVGVPEPEIVNHRILYKRYYSVSVELDYPIFKEGVFFGIGAPSVNAAEADRKREASNVDMIKEEIISSVSQTYVTILNTQGALVLAEEMVRVNLRRYEMIQAQARQQILSKEDVKIAELAWRASQQTEEKVRKALTYHLNQLTLQVGAGPEITIRVNGEPPVHDSMPTLDALIGKALLHNPAASSQGATIDAAQADLKTTRARRMPVLDFINNYIYADDFLPPGNNFMATILRLKVPIIDFGQYSSDARMSEMKVRAAEMMMAAVRSNITQSVTDAYTKLQDDGAALNVLDLQVQQAELQLKQVQAKVLQQILPPSAALDAEQALVDIKKTRLQMELNQRMDDIALRLAVGGPIDL